MHGEDICFDYIVTHPGLFHRLQIVAACVYLCCDLPHTMSAARYDTFLLVGHCDVGLFSRLFAVYLKAHAFPLLKRCTVGQNQVVLRHLIIHFPAHSLAHSRARKQGNEYV